MSDIALAKLVGEFETCTLEALDHEDHVRLGWFYLSHDELSVVLGHFPQKLRRFAASKGAAGKYHETITWAFLMLIHERIGEGPGLSWSRFAARNPDLLSNNVLMKFYSKEELACQRARRVFLLPGSLRTSEAIAEQVN